MTIYDYSQIAFKDCHISKFGLLTHISLASFYQTPAKGAEKDQMTSVASEQILHSLIPESTFEI